jgi:hypothetical protein
MRLFIPSLLLSVLGFTAPLAAEPSIQVELINQRALPGWQGDPVGNLVLVNRGKSMPLNTTATAQKPRVSKGGFIGWVDCSQEGNSAVLHVAKGVPIGSRLILRRPDGSLLTIPSWSPIIEKWNFDDAGAHVVMKSRGLHGPAVIERFTLSGQQAGRCNAYGETPPEWAISYLDR